LILFILSNLLFVNNAFANRSILLLGDSVSASYGMQQNQGWVHILNERLKASKAGYQIKNASISGETTGGGLSRLEGILGKEKVDHLLIELGGNDGLRGYSPKLIKNNLLQMIDIAKKQNIPVTVIKIKITPNYGPRYTKMLENVFDSVSKEKDVPLIPFFMEEIAKQPELMMEDGIHPNVEAQPLIADFVGKQLKEMMTLRQAQGE